MALNEIESESCRLCLSDKAVVYIFAEENSLANMISSLCVISVREDDGLPRNICLRCMESLQGFNDFRQQCIETDKILMLRNKIVYTEGTIKLEAIDDDSCHQNDGLESNGHWEDETKEEDWFEQFFKGIKEIKKKKKTEKLTKDKSKTPKPCARALCQVCGANVRRDHLNDHIRTHSEEKKFKCKMCPKTYKLKSDCNTHMRRKHVDELYATCDICQKTLAKTFLKKHIKEIHTETESAACDICGKVFKAKHLMVSHKKVHTKSFKCSHCDSMFSDRQNRNCHERLHTGETPYMCPCCPKGYAQLSNMKSHFKHNHKGIVFSEVYKKKQIKNG